jgi:hypothetical protein
MPWFSIIVILFPAKLFKLILNKIKISKKYLCIHEMIFNSFRQERILSQVLSISLSSPTEKRVSPSESPISFCMSAGTSEEVLCPEQEKRVLK